MRRLLLLACVAACSRPPLPAAEAPALPEASEDGSRLRVSLAALGLREAQQFNTQPTLSFPFFARSDRVLTAASLTLRFADPLPQTGIEALEISVNQEKVARLPASALRQEVKIPIDAAIIGDKNLLTLRLSTDREGVCGKISPDSWRAIESGEVLMQSAPLPLPDDLSLLPLPFVDRHFDREASVPMVLAAEPSPAELASASKLAGWFGLDTGVALQFPVSLGALPDRSAVVLISSAREAAALGLPAPEGPLLQMMAHPKAPGRKLLVASGRTPAELELAVSALAQSGAAAFKGAQVRPAAPLPPARAVPDEAPRWVRAGRPLRLGQVPGGEALIHTGLEGGKIAATFRLPPDLWVWPDEFVDLDLRWELALPPKVPQPRLDVLMNGDYLGRLRQLDLAGGEVRGAEKLRIHRSKLRGFNELVVYVNYADAERICAASTARVQILPESTLRIEKYGAFAPQPDIESFVDDGFPFTRLADLSETGVVLSAPLDPGELGLLFSTLAHFASVTGVAGAPAFVGVDEALGGVDKDLLIFGDAQRNGLIRRWGDRMPLLPSGEAMILQAPAQEKAALALFTGGRGLHELGRARGLLAALQKPSVLVAFEHPGRPGRTAVVLSGAGSFAQFRGFAEGELPRGDLLAASEGRRMRFLIGPVYGRGQLSAWAGLRWFLAQHPLLLVPFLFLGVLALALVLRATLDERVHARLSVGGPR